MATAPSPPQPPAVPVDCGLLANRTNLLSLRPEVVWCYNLDQPEYIALYGDCESYYSTSLALAAVPRSRLHEDELRLLLHFWPLYVQNVEHVA